MPKMKSKRCAAKRFSLTASGKGRYKQMNKAHILTKKAQAIIALRLRLIWEVLNVKIDKQ